MTKTSVADWAAARSDKWRRQLGGLEAMLAPLDEPLIAALSLTTAVRVADIGCGGGATTLAIARRAPRGSVVHGLDLSPALIEVARRRRAPGATTVAFEIADMGTTAPPALGYDRLVSRLGIMFFTDPQAAFANLRRWIVPGGRFAFAVWGALEENPWMTATRAAVADVTALAPIDPLAPGPFRYADVAVLMSLLAQAGFVDIEATDWQGTLPIGHNLPALEAAQFAVASFSSFAEILSRAGGSAPARAQRALAARFAPYERQGAVWMPACVHIMTGRVAPTGVEAP